jgi:hypothetical protein
MVMVQDQSDNKIGGFKAGAYIAMGISNMACFPWSF